MDFSTDLYQMGFATSTLFRTIGSSSRHVPTAFSSSQPLSTDMEPTAHHYGITVSDLDRTVAFYRDVLGLDVVAEFTVGGEPFATGVGVPDAGAEFVHLDAGDARIELVRYDPEAEARADGSLNEPGATHVGLAVADLDAVYEEIPDEVDTLSEPQTTESGTRILFVRDPEGNLVELLET